MAQSGTGFGLKDLATESMQGECRHPAQKTLLVRFVLDASSVRLAPLPALLGVMACSTPRPAPATQPEVSVAVGVPGGADGLDFVPLQGGEELRLKTFGQGGTHVYLGVRCIGFGSRAFIGFTLTNTRTGNQLVAPPPTRPQLLYCIDGDDRVCDLVPATIMTGGLTAPEEERDGLAVVIDVDVHNTVGAFATATSEVSLSTADL
jgi:hypothetical protein